MQLRRLPWRPRGRDFTLIALSLVRRPGAAVLCLCRVCPVAGDSALLLSEPNDFDELFQSDLCWLVLFTSLHELDMEEEAKRRFLLLPHFNKTFVTFASTTIEEQPDIAVEFGVNASNLPRVRA